MDAAGSDPARELGDRPDSNRRHEDHDLGCYRLHHGHSRADGIRTRDLELMRLARTAAPPPRKVWLAGLEPAISGFQGRRGDQLPHSQMVM
jgi:hypothetical protein